MCIRDSQYIEQPLIDKSEIEKRLDGISELSEKAMLRDEIREYLNPIYDLERLLGKVSYKTANPRDLLAFAGSLKMLPSIKVLLNDFSSDILKKIQEETDDLTDVCTLIERAICEEPVSYTHLAGRLQTHLAIRLFLNEIGYDSYLKKKSRSYVEYEDKKKMAQTIQEAVSYTHLDRTGKV